MDMAALNIQVDVSGLGIYEIEILKQKLSLYAQTLVAASKGSKIDSIKENKEMKNNTSNYKESIDFIKTLSVTGEVPVPDDANGIEVLTNEKYSL